jgi:signal transduction histidine kinase
MLRSKVSDADTPPALRGRDDAADDRRLAFLAEASHVLASSLDYATTLESVARLMVPAVADLCVVDMVADDGTIRRLAAAVADPAKAPLARELQRQYPVNPARPRGVPTVLRTGQPVIHVEVTDELLEAVAQDADHLALLHALDFHSTMLVPLAAHGRTLGVITFVRGRARAPYAKRDLALALDLAGRCSLAIENARLYGAERAARERLQAFLHRLVEVQETERRRIARELHDELGQGLTGLKLLLEMAAAAPTRSGQLDTALSLIGELITWVRTRSLELRPAILDDLGLLPALLWHLDRYTTQTGVHVDFRHSGLDRRFPPEVETAAYRLVQEALTNVARHARTREAAVRVWLSNNRLCLQIEDQGAGFDPWGVQRGSATSGLTGMRERAEMLGGQLAIDAAPGAGTRLVATLPLQARPAPPLWPAPRPVRAVAKDGKGDG